MRANTFAWALVALLVLPACTYAPKVVKVETSPPGAMVMLNGLLVGTAPCECVLPRSRGGVLAFEVLPPRESTDHLWTQQRTLAWKQLPAEGAVLYFDLRLEASSPVQPIEIRDR